MGKTFTNEPLGKNWRHSVATERGTYIMGKSWIDPTSPSDMMDYDFTDSWAGLLEASAFTHEMWAGLQVQS